MSFGIKPQRWIPVQCAAIVGTGRLGNTSAVVGAVEVGRWINALKVDETVAIAVVASTDGIIKCGNDTYKVITADERSSAVIMYQINM